MAFSFNSLLTEIQLHAQNLFLALAQDDLGLFFMYIWAEIVGAGIFMLCIFLRNHAGYLKKYEATIAGLDFTNPEYVEPVCEYTDENGKTLRARFGIALPSFSTGHKSMVYINKKLPTAASLPVMGYPLAVTALIFLAGGSIGAWYSYQEAASLSEWVTTSLKEIALTEVVLLGAFLFITFFEFITKNEVNVEMQKLLGVELFPFEEMTEVENRIGQFRRSMRGRRDTAVIFMVIGCFALYSTFGTITGYLLTEPAIARVVANAQLPPELIPPGETLQPEPAGKTRRQLRVEWVAPSGKTYRLMTEYPLPYTPLREYKTGDEVAIRLNPERAQESLRYRAQYDPGPVVATLHSLICILMTAFIFCIGRCMKLPKEWELCKDSVVLQSQNH